VKSTPETVAAGRLGSRPIDQTQSCRTTGGVMRDDLGMMLRSRFDEDVRAWHRWTSGYLMWAASTPARCFECRANKTQEDDDAVDGAITTQREAINSRCLKCLRASNDPAAAAET
jgi:hypothetical protein